MTDIETKLAILKDILIKKKFALLQILSMTENQESLLIYDKDNEEVQNMFSEINVEKKGLIDEVISCDNMFQSMFKEISEPLSNESKDYRNYVIELQQLIKEVMEIDNNIREIEQRNKNYFVQKNINLNPKILAPKVSKDYLLKQYKSNSK